MDYSYEAKLLVLDALNSIKSEADQIEFKDLLAQFFARKAQKSIDALWEDGTINEETIEQWGKEHMRTPYKQDLQQP